MQTTRVAPNSVASTTEQTVSPPAASVAAPSASVDGLSRSHFSEAGDAVKNAAEHVAAGLKRPFERMADKAATSTAAAVQRSGDSPYLKLIEPFHSVFVVNNSATLDSRSWTRIRTVLAQLLPLAALHSTDGVDVVLNDGIPTRLTDDESLGLFLRRLELADSVSESGAMAAHYLQKYSGFAKAQSVKPLNMIVLSDFLPTVAATQAIDAGISELSTTQSNVHGVRVQFCVTEPNAQAATIMPSSDVVGVTTVTAAVQPRELAQEVLVGKIGQWAQQAVADKVLD